MYFVILSLLGYFWEKGNARGKIYARLGGDIQEENSEGTFNLNFKTNIPLPAADKGDHVLNVGHESREQGSKSDPDS